MFGFLKKSCVVFSCALIAGCSSMRVKEVEKVGVIRGLDWPESVLVDAERNNIYISNIETIEMHGWDNDGRGFITAIVDDGKLIRKRWVDSKPWNILNAPKGMCIKDNVLYVADNSRLLSWPIKMPDPARVIKLPGAEQLNDIAADDMFIYVSDTKQGTIYKLPPRGSGKRLKAPKGVNGLACFEDKLFAVSISEGEIYEIDKTGRKQPRAVGLKKHFKGLDSIMFFDDGSSIVTDLRGNKLFSVNSDMTEVVKLADIKWPADLGIDYENQIIYVPLLKNGQVIKFQY